MKPNQADEEEVADFEGYVRPRTRKMVCVSHSFHTRAVSLGVIGERHTFSYSVSSYIMGNPDPRGNRW